MSLGKSKVWKPVAWAKRPPALGISDYSQGTGAPLCDTWLTPKGVVCWVSCWHLLFAGEYCRGEGRLDVTVCLPVSAVQIFGVNLLCAESVILEWWIASWACSPSLCWKPESLHPLHRLQERPARAPLSLGLVCHVQNECKSVPSLYETTSSQVGSGRKKPMLFLQPRSVPQRLLSLPI